jgi:hypothetical protein
VPDVKTLFALEQDLLTSPTPSVCITSARAQCEPAEKLTGLA